MAAAAGPGGPSLLSACPHPQRLGGTSPSCLPQLLCCREGRLAAVGLACVHRGGRDGEDGCLLILLKQMTPIPAKPMPEELGR